jgi:4-hydroxy-2-oxoheptanedioate aldolase
VSAFSLATRLRGGETVYCGWCALDAPIIAETVAREGFSAVNIDMQHGLWDFAATVTAVGAIAHAGAAPVVRVPLGDFAAVSRALDVGAQAIIVPMINSESDARALVAAAKYPPLGERSWGPNRAMALQGRSNAVDYLREANEGTLTLAMIETTTALANVDAIAATPGIDALFVGPYDLATALSGGTAQDVQAPQAEREIDRICAAAVKAGKIPGIYCRDAERALAMGKRGFRFLAVGSDLGFLRDGIAAQMKRLKG